MKGNGKKIISVIAAIAAVCAMGVAFLGCGGVQVPIDTDKKYVVFYDDAGNNYKVIANEHETVYYEYEENKTYTINYKIYYTQNDELTGEEGFYYKVDASKPGKYVDCVVTRIRGGGENWTFLEVVVKEKPRLTPEISFDPNGAIEYIENEKYVYEYNGQKHYPIMKLSYNNENLEFSGDGLFTFKDVNNEIPFNQCLREVGTYTAYYSIGTSYYKNEADQEIYSSVGIEITVEIIDSNQ